jgi:anti-sigma factor RsiW
MNERSSPITEDELHAYVDGVLANDRRNEVDTLLARDAELASRADSYRCLNTLLRERYDQVLLEPLPPRLRLVQFIEVAPALDAIVRDDSLGQRLRRIAPPAKRRWFDAANLPRFGAMAAMLLLGVGVGAGVDRGGSFEHIRSDAATGNGVARQVADDGLGGFARQSAIAHVMYAPDVERPYGASVDPAHEAEFGKWLSGRLGTAMVPPALMRAGYKLMGGRILRGDDGSFAQFTYNSASGERVTLCMARLAGDAGKSGFALYKDGPVKVFHWTAGDYGYSVAGGIKREKLLQMARDVSSAMVAGSGGGAGS